MMETITLRRNELYFSSHAFDYFEELEEREEELLNAFARTTSAFTYRRRGEELSPVAYVTIFDGSDFTTYGLIFNEEGRIFSILDEANARRNEQNLSSERNSTTYYNLEVI
jgi:hypothetical protein